MNPQRPLPREDLEFIEAGAEALWPQLLGARLFITGATGFFGRWLLESLLAADRKRGLGVRVTALSRNPDAFMAACPHLASPRLTWIKGSVTTLDADAHAAGSLDMVVHLATEGDMGATQADPRAATAVIVDGTRRALELASRTGARRFLFTSSGAVYGPQPAQMERISEAYPGLPGQPEGDPAYAIGAEAKRQAERLCLGRWEGLEPVIARCFTFAGPALPARGKFAFGNFMADALGGGPIVLTGDGTPVRSYLYAADLALWLWTLLLRGAPGRAYNVGSEHPITLRQLAEAIASETGSRGIEIQRHPDPDASPHRYVPSTARAREELGLRESFSVPEVIRRTAAWHRAEVKH